MVYTICLMAGSYLGNWIATLLGAGYFSGWGIIAGAMGGFAGIYIAFKINTEYLES